VRQLAVHPDGTEHVVQSPPITASLRPLPEPTLDPNAAVPPSTASMRVPLGVIAGARSGDKGGSANIGVWARSEAAWPWLAQYLDETLLRSLLPEIRTLPIKRHLLPNLHALNFVVDGILGLGVAYQARFDPQAKALAEWLRSRLVDVPAWLVDSGHGAPERTTEATPR
jgi:hypothetical protein